MKSIFRNFKKGEVVFCQDDSGDCAYIVDTGSIQISLKKDGQEVPLVVLGEGEIFGEMAIIDSLPRSATATALEDCRLSVISRESLTERIGNSDPVVRLLVSMFIRRARNMATNVRQMEVGVEKTIEFRNSDKFTLNQMRFEEEVRLGFSQKEFLLFYQPIVELASRKVEGFEALIRWNSPTMGMVRPDKFIGVIEESQMMIPVGRWITEQAMGDSRHLNQIYGEELLMSINISPKQLADPQFVEHLEETRIKNGLKANKVELEITEQVFMDGSPLSVIDACRSAGYRVALDDFGTGYSSISYLRQLNLDVLKVDQSFTRSANTDPKARAIVRATLSLANALNLDCVAEGIETPDIAATLVELGCRYGQGYLFGKPQALEAYWAATKAA